MKVFSADVPLRNYSLTHLPFAGYFRVYRLKSAIFDHCSLIVDSCGGT